MVLDGNTALKKTKPVDNETVNIVKDSSKYCVFHVEGGLGKHIMSTAVIRSIKKQYPERKLIVTAAYPEVFLNNPYIFRIYRHGNHPYFYNEFINQKDTLIFRHEPYFDGSSILKTKHLTEAWCDIFNVKLDNYKPEIYLTPLEEESSNVVFNNIVKGSDKKICILQCTGGGPDQKNSNVEINFSWYRDLPLSYADQVVATLSKEFIFVQIRRQDQLRINNTVEVQLDNRTLLSFLKKVHTGLLIDSFAQHVMAAFNKPSVVCWVGTSQKVFGYDMHTNLKAKINLFDKELVDSYLDPYSLIPQNYHAPMNYKPENLFSLTDIHQGLLKYSK